MRKHHLMILCVLCGFARAQARMSPELTAQLDRAQNAAEELERDLPNIACKQTAVSERLRGDKVKQRVAFEADLTVVRLPTGELKEKSRITSIDGKPVDGRIKVPILVVGGLTDASTYLDRNFRRTFQVSGNAGRIEFIFTNLTDEACKGSCSTTGFALFDDGGNLIHVEHRVSAEMASRTHRASYSAADLAPIALGAKTYFLSSNASSESPDGKDLLRFTTIYRDCRLFQASVKILPGVTVVPEQVPDR